MKEELGPLTPELILAASAVAGLLAGSWLPRGRQWAVRLTRFLTAWLVPGGLCVLLAAWRLRPAYLRQLRSTHSARRRWWHAGRPRIRGNPVAWRERYVLGIASRYR